MDLKIISLSSFFFIASYNQITFAMEKNQLSGIEITEIYSHKFDMSGPVALVDSITTLYNKLDTANPNLVIDCIAHALAIKLKWANTDLLSIVDQSKNTVLHALYERAQWNGSFRHSPRPPENLPVVLIILLAAGNNREELLLRQNDGRSHNTPGKSGNLLGRTILHYAAEHGHTHVVKLLLQAAGTKKLDLLLMLDYEIAYSALHYAACERHHEVIETLLDEDGIQALFPSLSSAVIPSSCRHYFNNNL